MAISVMRPEQERNQITRREVLNLALASPLLAAVPVISLARNGQPKRLDRQTFVNSPSAVTPVADDDIKQVEVIRQWRGALCNSRLVNRGKNAARVKEVVLFDLKLALPPETRLYGEGFQMLSQTGGALGQPIDQGNYTDAKHYKMPIPAGARSFYGLMTLAPPDGGHSLLAFTSCRRFSGQFRLSGDSLQVVVDTEGLELKPGESWELEEFTFRAGADRAKLLDELAQRMNTNHPPLRFKTPPTGWCSWYCFGPRVTAQQVRDNLDFIARNAPGLKYIQIDDGYQPAMGDWLETGAAFSNGQGGGNVRGVLKEIRERGFEPAIWVAPFIAEEKSHLFQQHPDWFIKDKDVDGKPLRSDKVTFGEFQFHATVIYASGGMLLSGDDLTKISPDRLAMLKKLMPPTGKAAEFADDTLRIGIVNLPNARAVCVFNWEDKPQTITVPLPRPSHVTDFWNGENLGHHKGSLAIKDLPPRSARLLICK